MILKNATLQKNPHTGKPTIISALESLAQRPIRPRAAFAIRRLLRRLNELAEDVESERMRLLEAHAKRDDDGEMIYKKNSEQGGDTNPEFAEVDTKPEFAEAYAELMDVTHEIEALALSDLESLGVLPTALLLGIHQLTTDDVGIVSGPNTTLKNALLQPDLSGNRPAFIAALETLVSKQFPFSLAVRIYRSVIAINAQADRVEQARVALAEQHAKRDKEGNIIYLDDEQRRFSVEPAYADDYRELLDETFTVMAIKASELENTEDMPASVYVALGDFLLDDFVDTEQKEQKLPKKGQRSAIKHRRRTKA